MLRIDRGSSTWEGSPSRGRKALISNIGCFAAYPTTGKASGVNPKEKLGVGVPTAVCICFQPHSGNLCDVFSCKLYRLLPLPWTTLVTWRGGSARATACSPIKPCPGLRPGEDTPALAHPRRQKHG